MVMRGKGLLIALSTVAALAAATPATAAPTENASCNAFLVHGLSPPGDLRNNFPGNPGFGPFGYQVVRPVATAEHGGSLSACLP
jgi:hypothetical protein